MRLEVDEGAPAGCVLHSVGSSAWRTLGTSHTGSDLTAAICFWLRPRGGLRVRVLEQAPFGSGIGGSSSFGVALTRAILHLEQRQLEDAQVAALLRDLEARVLTVSTGTQDHWAALLGGALAVHHEPGGERIEELTIEPGWIDARLSLYYTGITHHSGMVNWQVIRRRFDGDRGTAAGLSAIADAAKACRVALLCQDQEAVAETIRNEWQARRQLAPEVCPSELLHLQEVAHSCGAMAFKTCGAGGGGTVLVWHGDGMRGPILAALSEAAPQGYPLPVGAMGEGCRTEARDSGTLSG